MRLLIIFLFLSFSQNSFSQNVNTNDLDNYLKIYINMSGMLGVDLKYVYNQKIKMEYINAKDLFKLDNAIALAWGMNKDDEVTIMVDRTQWLRLSLMEKMSVMFHELSDIYIGIELLLDTYINQQLVDRTMSAQNRNATPQHCFPTMHSHAEFLQYSNPCAEP